LLYLENKGYSQYDFSKKTGLSNGFLKAGNSISSENLKLLSTIYDDLNLIWTITGEGKMLKNTGNIVMVDTGVAIGNDNNGSIDNRQYYSDSPDVLRSQIDEKDRLLAEKEMRIKEKDAQIKEKDAQINKLLSILSNK
jgi:hypothetical protein